MKRNANKQKWGGPLLAILLLLLSIVGIAAADDWVGGPPFTTVETGTVTGGASPATDFTYTSNVSGITITGYIGPGGDVIIPGTINGLPVVGIASNAFRDKTALTSVTIPHSVTTLGASAFHGCTALISVTIGNSVTTIGASAFYGCTALTSVTIGNNVTTIGSYAFYWCTALTSVTIPDSVTSIGEYAFYNCAKLTSVTIGNGVTTIGEYAFGYAGMTSVTIGNGVTTIGDYAFHHCPALTSVTIPDSVTTLGYSAFSYCAKLTSVTIGNGVTNMGLYAFGYTALTSVTIGNGVTTIGNYAFYSCTNLTSVTIPDSVTSIGHSAFHGCPALTSVTIGNGVTTIGYSAFGYTALTSVTIPDSVTSIGSYAFYNCANLTTVTIGNGVTTIGSYAFYECANLTTVTIGNSVTSIGASAFEDCPALASITIPDSVISIGASAFEDCPALTTVTIGNGVTTIGASAFEDCANLTTLTIGNSVTTIGASAFEDCPALTSVTIPDSVTTIGASAFRSTGLTTVTIGNGVTTIGASAFEDCPALTSVTIGNGVTTISNYAFYDCPALTSMVFTGNAPTSVGIDWVKNSPNVVIYYYEDATGWSTPLWNNVPCYPLVSTLVADFVVTATNGLAPITVSFTDASTVEIGTIDTWRWEYRIADNGAWTEFGAGAQNPADIVFSIPGTYDIRLTVSNAGESDTKTVTHVFSAAIASDPLVTVESGTVSGDLYMNAVSPWTTSATQIFTLPAEAVGNVQWAQLHVNIYSGSYTSDRRGTSVVTLDGTVLGTETLDVWQGFPTGSADPTYSVSGKYAYPVNERVMKVMSDYEAVYDVTSLITTSTPSVTVTNTPLDGYTFDGRIKGITLLVAYNDGDNDQIMYIVNHGNDWMAPAGESGSTVFDASEFGSGWSDATVRSVAHSGTDGAYTFNAGTPAKTELLGGSYIKWDSFDVNDLLTSGSNTFAYTAVGSSFKICTAALTAKYPAATPPIQVESPNGGETWTLGSAQSITWSYTGNPGPSVKIEALKGETVIATIPSVPIGSGGSGSFNLTVPFSTPLGDDYRFRVTSTSNPAYTDVSDAPFTIASPIVVVSPDGGEVWQLGSAQAVQWSYTGNPGSTVKIEALRGETVVATIPGVSIGSGGSGSFNLTVPFSTPLGDNYRFRVTSTSNPAYTDVSDAPFTICADSGTSITLDTPNGNENYVQGSTQTIQWHYTGNPGPTVKIEALRGDKVLATVASSYSIGSNGTGSYDLTFPYNTPLGSDYRIRVTSNRNPAWTDTSDAPFTISPAITVISPNGGSYPIGSILPMGWTYTGNPGATVKIDVFKGGRILKTLTGIPIGSGGSGWYNVTIPASTPIGADYQIRVSSTTYPACTDTTDLTFAMG